MFHTISVIKPKSEKYHTPDCITPNIHHFVYLEMSGCHHDPMNSHVSIRSKMIQEEWGWH